MKKVQINRDVSVELLRIIACLFVIFIHIGISPFMDNTFKSSSTFFSCLFSDAVAIFWFITGAFLLKKDNYGTILKGTLKKVIFPSLALIIFILFFNGWMFEGQSIPESIQNGINFIPSAFECIFLWWATPVAHTGQLWYIFVYVFVIICSPAIRAFSEYLDKNHQEKLFLIISFCLLLLNDISNNHFANFDHTIFGAFFPATILILWGHIFYQNKEKILKAVKPIYFFLTYIGLIVIRTITMIIIYKFIDNTPNQSILYWFSSFSLLTTTSLFLFLEGNFKNFINGKISSWLIIKTGSYTFIIYLLHELIIDLLNKFGISLNPQDNIIITILSDILMGIIIFLIGLVIGIFFRLVSKSIQKSFIKITKVQRTK